MLADVFHGCMQKRHGCLYIRVNFEKGCLEKFIDGKIIINNKDTNRYAELNTRSKR